MSDGSDGKPMGKIMFGFDYLNLFSYMEYPKENEKVEEERMPVVFAAIRLFLLHWDFSVDEIDEAQQLFYEKIKSNSLDKEMMPVMDRLADFLKDDRKAQERFLTEMAAIAQMEDTILEDEGDLLRYFQAKFDFRQSEMEQIYSMGWSWRIALDYFGEKYFEYMNSKTK